MKFFQNIWARFRAAPKVTISAILLPKTFVITYNGNTYTILRSDEEFQPMYDAYHKRDYVTLQKLLKENGYIKEVIEAVNEELIRHQMQMEQDDDENLWNEEDEQETVDAAKASTDALEQRVKEMEAIQKEIAEVSQASNTTPTEEELPDAPAIIAEAKKTKKTGKFMTLEVGDNGALLINGVKFENTLTEKIAQLYFAGHSIESYYNLLRKISENSESVIRSGLLDFILINDLPITTDGCFLAYKVVRHDGYDHHSKSILYEVGKEIKEDRKLVSKDRGECSGKGLYFASRQYYGDRGYYTGNNDADRRFLVKVDPIDVVSIPHSYQHSKGRCCRYVVVKEIGWDKKNIPCHKGIVDVNTLEGVTTFEEPPMPEQREPVVEVGGTQDHIEKMEMPSSDKLYAKKDKQGRYRTMKGHFIKAEDLHLFTIIQTEVKPLARKDRAGKYRNAKGHFIKAEDLHKYSIEE